MTLIIAIFIWIDMVVTVSSIVINDNISWHTGDFLLMASVFRPRVPGALSGFQLGEAAHRLLKNTLNLKSDHNNYGPLEQYPCRNSPGNHVTSMPRAAGPSGFGRGFTKDLAPYYGNHNQSRAIMGAPRSALSPYELQGNRQNFRTLDRNLNQEQNRNLNAGMSALTIEEVRTRPHAVISSRMPNSGQFPNNQSQYSQNIALLPSPPSKWIIRPPPGNNGMHYKQQQTSSAATFEKQVKKVYQAKGLVPFESAWSWIPAWNWLFVIVHWLFDFMGALHVLSFEQACQISGSQCTLASSYKIQLKGFHLLVLPWTTLADHRHVQLQNARLKIEFLNWNMDVLTADSVEGGWGRNYKFTDVLYLIIAYISPTLLNPC